MEIGEGFVIKGVDSVPYLSVRLVYTVPASKPVHINPPCFIPEKIPAVLINFGQYWPIHKFFFFFLSVVIFEFLLGQNGNLFALTY